MQQTKETKHKQSSRRNEKQNVFQRCGAVLTQHT